LNEFS